jgi:uncharacterized protein involved in exopolysaccharide biosynthesis
MSIDTSNTQDNQPEDEIDLFALWDTLMQSKWLIMAITALSLILATTLAFIMTPKYEAKVIATFTEEGKSSGGLSALAGQFGGLAEMAGVNLGGGGSNKEAMIAYLKSRIFIEGFIKENNLMPILYAKQWDEANKKWLDGDPEDLPTPWKAYKFFSEKVADVQMDKKTSLITLTITWKNREQAVEWANALIKRANANLREKTITETQLSQSYLEKELQKTSVVEVQNTIYRVLESQIKTMMIANTQEQFAFKVIDPAALMDENAFVKPKRPMIIALGGIAGLFLGILFVFIRQAIRNRKAITQPNQLKSLESV